MGRAHLAGVEAGGRRVAQQPEVQRIAGTGRQVGVVGEHDRLERPRQVDGVNRPHVHAALGERAGLVGGDDGDRPERLDRRQPAHHRAVPRHPFHPQGQRHGQHRRQPLRHGGHGEGHREDDHFGRVAEPFGSNARHADAGGQQQHPARDPPPEFVDPALERRLRHGDAAEQRCQAAHRTGGSGAGGVEEGLAAHQQRAAHDLVAAGLVDRHRLASEHRLVEHRPVGLTQHAVGRHPIAGLEPHPIAGHHVGARQAHQHAVAQHPRLCRREGPQVGEGRLGAPLLRQAQHGIEQQDHADRGGFDRPALGPLEDPQTGIEGEREQ